MLLTILIHIQIKMASGELQLLLNGLRF